MDFAASLDHMGLKLPPLPSAKGLYRPIVHVGQWLYLSGQLPLQADGSILFPGHLGENVSVEEGQEAGRLALLNGLALVAHEQEKIKANWGLIPVKLQGFVAATASFTEHPKVLNGASELAGKLFGENLLPARVAVGVVSLPLGASVELDLVFRILE